MSRWLDLRGAEPELASLSNLVPGQWPGGDGFTKEDVLHEYPALAARKLVPGADTLNRLHPDLAAELARFFWARSSRQVAERGVGVQTSTVSRTG